MEGSEVEEEVWVLQSLTILARIKVRQVNKEWDKADEAFTHMYVNKSKKKKVAAKLRQEMVIL